MQTTADVSQIYALLRRNYRVSRTTRAIWQFEHIAVDESRRVRIPTSEEITESSEEITIISALDSNGSPISPSTNIICTNATRFSYFTTRYKFAFILDMTDSCASVSIDGGHIYLESLTNCLCILLYSLAQTLILPGCELKFQPEIDISVYVYFPLHRTPSHQVLIHGYRLTWATLESVCRDIGNNLREATELLHNIMSIGQPFHLQSASSTMNSDDNINSHLNSPYQNSESSCAVINMLSYGITALQLMPEESTAGLVIITDGILDVPNLPAFEAVMRQIRARIISCSFVQIGAMNSRTETNKNNGTKAPIASLGHVPNEELLKFISSSTFGSFIYFDVDHVSGGSMLLSRLFSQDFNVMKTCRRLRDFQHELLSWGFHKAINDYSSSPTKLPNGHDETSRTSKSQMISLPVSCKLVNQTVLQTSLENVLSLRLREGYAVKRVQFSPDEIEVHLVLPWHYDIQVYYAARSSWPLQNSVRTDIRVYKEAPVYFLKDLKQILSNSSMKTNETIRHNLIRRYNDVIQMVSVTDRHLTLINTFSQNSAYYHVPESIKRAKSIFQISPDDPHHPILTVKDKDLQPFADFWLPIVILDGSLWQRFMYTHNLTLILVSDSLQTTSFLMNHHHLSQSHNTHQSPVSYRSAKAEFETFLSEYFSFILLNGQAYIKFLFKNDSDSVPYSFMLLRVMGQPPLLYLKFAFQSNATTVDRHRIIEEFRNLLIRLRSRLRMKSGNNMETTRKQQTSTPISTSTSRSSLSTFTNNQRPPNPCCIVLNKNIERLVLKPDLFPYKLVGIQKPDDDDHQHQLRNEPDSKRQALSKFFYIRTFVRSFESIKHSSNIPKRIADIIIETLILRRLQEGFHFVSSLNNIYNLVLEVNMNKPEYEKSQDVFRLNPDVSYCPDEHNRTCLVQYRIYPVEYGRATDTSPVRDNRAMSLRRLSNIYSDFPTSYFFVTQCWIEPQDGTVDSTNNAELEYLSKCTYKQIVDKIGDVDRECFNTLVSFYFVKYLQERSLLLPRAILRAPRVLTSDVIRVPFVQDTINLIRRSHQTYFDFSTFIDDYDRIKHDFIENDGSLPVPSLNSTFLTVLRDKFCSKTYEAKPQLFTDNEENHNAFTRILIARSNQNRISCLPLGLSTLKANPYLLYLLNYDDEHRKIPQYNEMEQYLIEMLFPRWDFLVCADGDEYLYMILFPKTERDLLLLNTDLNILMRDLISHYSQKFIDGGHPVYEDGRCVMENLLDEIESRFQQEKSIRNSFSETNHHEGPTNKHTSSIRRRPRRDTFTSSDLLPPSIGALPPQHNHNHNHNYNHNYNHNHIHKGTTSSSPVPISHQYSHHFHHSSSQPAPSNTTSYRRTYSPLTVDANHIDPSPRRYSASAAVSPPNHQNHLTIPPILNLVPSSPIDMITPENIRKFIEFQWKIPIFLYSCKKSNLSSSLVSNNEHQMKNNCADTYFDCTKDDNEPIAEMMITTTTTTYQTHKNRKRDNSRRQDDELAFLHNKQADDMRDSMDYAFATAFYRNCLLELNTHRSDVDYALNNIYREHYEDIDLTNFLRAMCQHLNRDAEKKLDLDMSCEPTTKHIETYLNDKFLEIISKYFHRVSPDSDYFYFCTDEDRQRPSRNSLELDERLPTTTADLPANGGPYKFDESNTNGLESDKDSEIDRESVDTVHFHNHRIEDDDDDEDDEELGMNMRKNRRQSDVSSGSLSNRSRELSGRGEILPLFLCFSCQPVARETHISIPVKTIPICISQLLKEQQGPKFDLDLDLDHLTVSFSLLCVTFEREDIDSQGPNNGIMSTNTPTFNQPFLSSKRYADLNAIDAIENTSTCTGTTMIGDLNKHPLDKLRLSEPQRRAISTCRREIEWLLRDEQLSTYFTRRSLDRKLIENVIEHVQTSVNIQKSNCLCRTMDLFFVLGIEKSLRPFLDEIHKIQIQEKFRLIERGNYFVLLEPIDQERMSPVERRISSLSTTSNDDRSSAMTDDSTGSDGSSLVDDDEEQKSSEDELDDFIKPSFWLFIEKKQKSIDLKEILEVRFYLYCGSSSDTTQKSCKAQAILDELIVEFNRLCRTINQKLLLRNLATSSNCNQLLVPPGENEDDSTTNDIEQTVLTANLSLPPGTFACDELWTQSFPLHSRIRPHPKQSSKSSSSYGPGTLLTELSKHFSPLLAHNRKNLFVYCGEENDYYMRFREEIPQYSTPCLTEDSTLSMELYSSNLEPPSPQTLSQNPSMLKNRQRHDSGTSCIHVMLYGLKSAVTDRRFEDIKSNLTQSIVTRLEEEVAKELVNALYHYNMLRLNPDDVTFIRPIDSSPKHIFEFKISPLINTNVFLYYFRRYVKTNQHHQPLLLPILTKNIKEIIKDYRGQTLVVYCRSYNMGTPRPGLAWIELHVSHPSNRPSPFSIDDLTDDLNVQSLIDLIQINEHKTSQSTLIENPSDNILRCHVWARGGQSEVDPTAMSSALLQAFSFVLADYATEHKLLPTLYNNQRNYSSYEPPPSPQTLNNSKSNDENMLTIDRNLNAARTFTLDAVPTTPTIHSRRHSTNSAGGLFNLFSKMNRSHASHSPVKFQRQESVQSSLLSSSSVEEPQSLSIEQAECLTQWFQYLTTKNPKPPSLTTVNHTLSNRILLMDIVHNFTLWLNEQKFIAYKHESLHGMIFRCNQERTLYLPVSSFDQLPTRIPGQSLNLIVLYQSSRATNDLLVETSDPSPQQDSADQMALANSSDILKQIFLCIIANDKKLTMILHNAPDEPGKILTQYFSNMVLWANKRLNVLNIIMTQKMGLFRYRSFHHDQHSDYNRHQNNHNSSAKHSTKGENVDLEQVIKEALPPKIGNMHVSWNIDLLYCNLTGAYPSLSNDSNQDLVQRHGTQLLQLKEQKKIHMDRCTKLEEVCANWNLKPKLFIADELLTQMKHRSRLLSIAAIPILFSRSARQFFQNDFGLRSNAGHCLDASSVTSGAMESSWATRMTNKRKSVAIPVDPIFRRLIQSADEVDFPLNSIATSRIDATRLNNLEQPYIRSMEVFVEQLSSHLSSTYKFHPISTKLSSRKNSRSAQIQSSIEHNFHLSDSHRRATFLAEISSLNHVELVLRLFQYDIVKAPITLNNPHFRFTRADHQLIPEQTEIDAFAYDYHLQTIVNDQLQNPETNFFTNDFSLINFLQEFIEFYPTAPPGSKTALFRVIIRHPIEPNKRSADNFLFKYVLEHAETYNITSRRRNSDEFLYDCDSKEIFSIAARTTPNSASELAVALFIIYTNLNPKTIAQTLNNSSTLNKIAIPSIPNNVRVTNSLKNNGNTNLMRERASTILLPTQKFNLVVPVRTSAIIGDSQTVSNIPPEKNVEFFRSKFVNILTKASSSHRRESLWERLIASRPESGSVSSARQENIPININELQALLNSCVNDETAAERTIASLLQRVFPIKDQFDRLVRFLRMKYGSQFHMLNSSTINYLVIFHCKVPQQCDAFLVLIYRPDQSPLESFLIKHRHDIDCEAFIENFTQKISYFLWECLIYEKTLH